MILDEYLVALGFQIDEAAWKKWQDRVSLAGVSAAKLGIEVTGAAAAVTLAIDRIAKQYDSLYFASQRVRSSVADIRSFQYAGKSVGVAYDEARGSIEAFAAATRMNPGLQALLRQMGVDPNDSVKGSTALVGKLKQQFGENGYFVAARVAAMYGLEERTFKQLWTNYGRLVEQQTEFARRTRESGVDMDQLAQKSRNWTQATDNLLMSLGLITDQAAARWLPAMTSGVEWLDKLAQGMTQVGRNTDGWSSSILAVVAALGAAKAAAMGLALIPGMGGIASAMGAPAGWAAWAATRLTGPLGFLLGSTTELNSGEVDLEKLSPAARDAAIKRMSSGAPTGAQARQQVIDYFIKQGWTRAQATGIAANFHAESKFNPAAVGDGGRAYGIGQWHPDRQANFKRLFGKDIRGSSIDEQMAFANWELHNSARAAGDQLRGTRSAAGAGAAVSRYYERPQNVMSEAAQRGLLAQQWFNAGPLGSPGGGAQVSISQKTDIHVNGVSNPAEAAGKVADSQDRINGDLVRNTRGAVR